MTPVFPVVITGDRSAHPAQAIPIVQQIVLQHLVTFSQQPFELMLATGLDRGVEAAVRFVAKNAGIALLEFEFLTKEWESYALMLRDFLPVKVYFVHSDPSASSLYPAMSGTFDDNVFELVDPSLLFANIG